MELVETYDNKRRPLGKKIERYHYNEGEYILGVHVWIMNSHGEVLLQKRSDIKQVYPGMWSITGGGNDPGETTLETVVRECKEELGIDVDLDKLELMLSIKRDIDFLEVWLLRQDIDIKDIIMQKEEVADVKWVSFEEAKSMINNRETAPNLKIYIDMFEKILHNEFYDEDK